MAEDMTAAYLASFVDELEKIAAGPSALMQFAGRLGSPIKGMKEGWRLMSPKNMLHGMDRPGSYDLLDEITSGMLAHRRDGLGTRTWKQTLMDPLRKSLNAGSHLWDDSKTLADASNQGVKGVAEELSRRGWTGTSKAFKYVPVGEKSMATLGAVSAIPSTVRAAKDPEHEGLGAAVGGGLGGLAGDLVGFGLPRGQFALSLGGAIGGAMAGNKIQHMMQKKPALPTAPQVPTPGVNT